jgi:hypothetical protein
MAFSINDFKTNALQNGIMKSNLYEVSFVGSQFPNKLSFFTDSIQLPNVDLTSDTVNRYGYGPIDYFAYRPTFEPLRMSFMIEAFRENAKTLILSMMSAITPFMNYNSMSDTNLAVVGGSSALPYEVAYSKDYQFDLQVYVFDETGNQNIVYNFRQCYAKQISGIDLAWSNDNSYLKCSVTFVYTDFSIDAQTSFNSSSIDPLNNQPTQNASTKNIGTLPAQDPNQIV